MQPPYTEREETEAGPGDAPSRRVTAFAATAAPTRVGRPCPTR